ncbi:Acetyl-coenzyme A synthetase [Pseudovibrio sp. Ad46]|uniref:propionyl-CoA synthetase n=1 Tax=Pseudovibrio sp. Ad46 TaxID=989432 RepID=UPI0007AEAD7F|nr:propionyl-CoA synthetase [Pseudovibrio sp. Ad46]KZK76505.1 Acetyl-coenzyme A synthetase [Pseudovibrio sp. Ad46]
MTSRYHDIYNGWKENKEAFWDEAAKGIDWFSPYTKTFDASQGTYGRWFVGGECNTCYNCVDRHVEHGRPGQPAIIYDSAVTGEKRTYTYLDVQEQVGAMAALLREKGVEKGTMVLIYMPMIPEATFAMLACARLGAIHSVVFGGFAAQELAVRIEDCKPQAIISASCGIEPGRVVEYKPLLDRAIELSSHKPDFCFIQQREQKVAGLIEGRDFDLDALMETAVAEKMTTECVSVAATDPLYVLYTSGTTGQPKGVVRDNGGHMVALKWSMENLYGIDPGEVFWAASDVGWVVGHSYIVYAPLLHGAATILYEGKPVGTPDAGAFWRVISEHSVVSLFTAPTAFRAIKKEDPEGKELAKYSIAGLRSLFLAGERADPDTILWAENLLGVPVIDHWWQTETGWCIAGNPLGLGKLPIKLGSSTVPMPGYDMHVLDDEGNELGAGELGNIVVKLPMPPGSLPTLWNADDRFKEAYLTEFPGYYKTADAGLMDDDGYLFIMARTDDIINVAGHRLSTGGMEEVLSEHPDVAECAVIGIADNLKGQLPCGFVVLKSGVEKQTAVIEKELVALVREKVGPVAAFKLAITVERLPKTRSGKILRATMRKIADGEEFKMPATIDDPAILEEIAEAISVRGVASVS